MSTKSARFEQYEGLAFFSCNARIGADCHVGQSVVISPDVVFGNGVKIQNSVSVYPWSSRFLISRSYWSKDGPGSFLPIPEECERRHISSKFHASHCGMRPN